MLMEPAREQMKSVLVIGCGKEYLLALDSEDFSTLYPGMMRYVLTSQGGGRPLAVFRTNTFEYSPLSLLAARTMAQKKAAEWEQDLLTVPSGIFQNEPAEPVRRQQGPATDLVIIQGSTRPERR